MKENQGNLSTTGLPGLLHHIYRRRDPAATLDIIREPIKKRFFFKDGIPVFATSNILGEVLGRLLMAEGIITQREYESSLEEVLKKKRKHGEVLISMGLLTPDELSSFLNLQLKRRIWKLFAWNEGVYRYARAEALPEWITPMPMPPARLILDGISLGFYPLERINNDLKEYIDVPVVSNLEESGYDLDSFGLKIQEKRFLAPCDGQKTLKEVLSASDLLKQRALSLALSFVITGVIKKAGEEKGLEPDQGPFAEAEKSEAAPQASAGGSGGAADDQRVNAELLFMRAKNVFAEGDYQGAANVLSEITELNPMEGEYWAWLGWAIFNLDPARIDEAEKTVKDSIDLNNELDSAWFFLGEIFLARGNIKGAETAFKTAYSKNPWMLEAVSEIKRLEASMALEGSAAGPFSPVPAAKPVRLSAGQDAAMEFLVRGIRKKAGPLLLEGPAGSGKTTLILELLRRLSNTKTLAAVILRPAKSELQLIKAINEEVGASTSSSSIKEQLLSLGMRISQNKIQSGHTIIVIDSAHDLTDGCLKLVQYLARLKSLQIVLLSEPGMTMRIKSPELKELDAKLLARGEIKPYTDEEAGRYVTTRLAKGSPGTTFTDEELAGVIKQGKGLPGLINVAAAGVLQARAQEAGETPAGVSAPGAGAPEAEPFTLEPIVPVAPEPGTTPELVARADEFDIVAAGDTPAVERLEVTGLGFEFEEVTEEDAEKALEPLGSTEMEPPAPPAVTTMEPPLVELAPEAPPSPPLPDVQPMPEEPPLKAGPAEDDVMVVGKGGAVDEPAPGPAPASVPSTAAPAAAPAGRAKKPARKRGTGRLLFWIIVMLLLGLITGSVIGLFWFDKLGGFF